VRREIGGYYGDQSQYALAPLTTVNLSAALTISKKTQLTAYVHNLENKTVTLFRFSAGDVAISTGRRYGLQLTQQL
jgi:outer membrane receptor protein involved in Fe transport